MQLKQYQEMRTKRYYLKDKLSSSDKIAREQLVGQLIDALERQGELNENEILNLIKSSTYFSWFSLKAYS